MLNSNKGLLPLQNNASHNRSTYRDRSILFKEILLDASIKNEFGFKEQDILPLFLKYQSKRQVLIDILSFFTYIFQLPTLFYLRRFHKNKYILERSPSHFDWFTTSSKHKP